jgi:UDP-3-O-[3-hydroxymyristoyl] glucosamine N-acyltransferase
MLKLVKIPLSLLKQESLVQPKLVKWHDWWTGIAGHLTIGDNVRIQASWCWRNIKDNEVLQGSPAFDTMITNHTFISRTSKLVAAIEELKKQILNQKNGNNG